MNHKTGFKSILYTFLLCLVSPAVSAQYYNTGQDPASVKWLQVKTGNFTVIYPETYGSGGIQFAKELEKAYSEISSFFSEKKLNIPVIIHNYTTQANGYVAWAPKRMEIYPTPDQNSLPLDNKRQLALHELTHIMQMQSLTYGFSKVMSLIFGQQFPGVVVSLLPLWYMEGEAVFNESLFTESGRGRSPGFQNLLKAISIEKGEMYKYDKLLNGSYKDYTPDYYQFGYQMYTWALLNNDPGIWSNVREFTASQPFTLNPVNISLRRSAGLTKKKLSAQTFDSLGSIWKQDLEKGNTIDYNPVNPPEKTGYESYYSAVHAGKDSVIAVKTSLSDPVSFVLINPSEKTGKKLFVPGKLYSRVISYADGKIVWVESLTDPRWANRNYSVIKTFDIHTKTALQLTCRSRYLSASISPDGSIIAATENTEDNRNNLVLINADDGSVINSVPAPGNAFLQRPQWSGDGKKLTLISLTGDGEGILSYSSEDNEWKTLLNEGIDDIHSAFLRNDSLFYVSSASGTDNIYLLTGNGKLSAVTRSKFGATDMTITGNRLFFSNYTSTGNKICITSLAEAEELKNPVSGSALYLIDRFEKPRIKEEADTVIKYTPEPYRKWKHLFGIHSWMPLYADIEAIQDDPSSVRPGLTLMSQNQLSTLTASAGYEYSSDNRHKFHSRIIWEGWYPVIESRFDYGNEPVIDLLGSMPAWIPSQVTPGFRLLNNIYIPWSFSTGKFSQYFYPSFSVDYRNDCIYERETGNYDYGQTNLTGRLYFANYHRSAYRDIYPHFGQIIDASYEWAPFDKHIYGSDFSAKVTLYFPGFIKNHGIRIRYETENQSFVKYLMDNKIHYPRSYYNIISEELDFFSMDYVAPLVYPDFNIGALLYMTRIRTGLFYDYARGKNNYYLKSDEGAMVVDNFTEGTESFSSFGIELLSDFYFLRIPYPISAGVQAAWKNFNEAPSFEFLFNIDIYGMNIGKLRR
jgi:hypothetical protein